MIAGKQKAGAVPGRIGVVGGMGPYAGLDLVRKIFDQTVAGRDQDHLDVLLLSTPTVPDRTRFLLEGEGENPGYAIAGAIRTLESSGAVIAGIPCNTVHSPRILDVVREELRISQSTIRFLSIIEETIRALEQRSPRPSKVGVLSTTGTLQTRVYSDSLQRRGFQVLEPSETLQRDCVQKAIYDTSYGIKSQSNPVTAQARSDIEQAVRVLAEKGVDIIVLGCTELPLAVPETKMFGVPLVDPALVLARALIRETSPEKLKPLPTN